MADRGWLSFAASFPFSILNPLSSLLLLFSILYPLSSLQSAPATLQADTKTHAASIQDGSTILDASTLTLTLGGFTVKDSAGIATINFGATNGTKLGATGNKLGFFGATPIVKPTGSILTALGNLGLVGTPSLPFSSLSSIPTTIAGYGITDFNSLGDARWVKLAGSYANPSWITSLPFSKLTSTPTTIAGYGITDFNSLGDARWPQLSGSYANPSWITSLPFSKLTSTPTTLAGYGITDAQPLDGDLTSIAALTTTSYGRDFLALANTAAAKTKLAYVFSDLGSLPTTIAGYGITDFNSLGDARWPQLSGSYANPSWITSLPFSKLTSTPTTLAGYGITDLVAKTDTANTFVPLQTFNSLNTYAANAIQLSNPGAPVVTNVGTAGATTWRYKIVAVLADGNTTAAGSLGSTNTGNATLDATNKNSLTWSAVTGASSYDVYRTVAGLVPSTTGKIANVTTPAYIDAGAAGDSATPPAVNNTGSINAVNGTYTGTLTAAASSIGTSAVTGNETVGGTFAVAGQVANLAVIDVSRAPYSADMTGVADSTTALNNAIAAGQAATKAVYIPAGSLKIVSTINVTSPVTFTGPGKIVWGGASGGAMMKWTHFDQLDKNAPTRLYLDGANLAASGLEFDGVTGGVYDLKVWDVTTGWAVRLHGSTGFTDSYKTFINLDLGSIHTSGTALLDIGGTHAGNACHNTFINTKLVHGNKDAIRIGGADNDSFLMTFIYRCTTDCPGGISGTGAGVRVDPTEAINLPTGMQFFHLQAGLGGWVQPSDSPLPGVVYSYMQDNGQPNPVLNGSRLIVLNGNGDFSGLFSLNVEQGAVFGNDVTAFGNLFAKNRLTSDRAAAGVFTVNYGSTGIATYITQGDSASPGFVSGTSISAVNAGALLFRANANAVVGTDNGAPLILISGDVERARVSNSGFTIGAGGTPMTKKLSNNITWNIPSTGAAGLQFSDFAFTGAAAGDEISISPSSFYSGIMAAEPAVTGADTVRLVYYNMSGGTLDPVSQAFRVTITKY